MAIGIESGDDELVVELDDESVEKLLLLFEAGSIQELVKITGANSTMFRRFLSQTGEPPNSTEVQKALDYLDSLSPQVQHEPVASSLSSSREKPFDRGIHVIAGVNTETPLDRASSPVFIAVDDSHVAAFYANMSRITGSPEEVVMDFGLNPDPIDTGSRRIRIFLKIVISFFTAKRLIHALSSAIQRHENVFGEVITDIQRRVKPRPSLAF